MTTSNRSKKQLESLGFKVDELSQVDDLDLTVDGADRVADNLDGIKGGGGALTLEKSVWDILADRSFGCCDLCRMRRGKSGCPGGLRREKRSRGLGDRGGRYPVSHQPGSGAELGQLVYVPLGNHRDSVHAG